MGCFAHILVLTLQYMEYDISTSVEVMYEDIIHLPSITFCTSIAAVLKWDDNRLQEKCAEITGDASCTGMSETEIEQKITSSFSISQRSAASEKILHHFSISDILTNLTTPVDGLLFGHYRYNDKKGVSEVVLDETSNTFDIEEIIMIDNKCYTLAWKEKYAHPDYWDIRRLRKSMGLFQVFIFEKHKAKTLQWLLMSYGGNNNSFRYGIFDQMIIPTLGYTISTFQLVRSQFLPPPFPTNCRDYETEGFDNRAGCYEICFAEMTWTMFKLKPQAVRMDQHDGNMSMTSRFMDDNSDALKSLSGRCKKECVFQDCQQDVYTTIPKSSMKKQEVEMVSHGCALPTSPVVATISMAKITFTGFATDVSSTLGFWLGLSVLSIMKWAKRMLRRMNHCPKTGAHRVKRVGRMEQKRVR